MQFCFPFAQRLVDGIVNVSMLIGSFCGCNLNNIHQNFIKNYGNFLFCSVFFKVIC